MAPLCHAVRLIHHHLRHRQLWLIGIGATLNKWSSNWAAATASNHAVSTCVHAHASRFACLQLGTLRSHICSAAMQLSRHGAYAPLSPAGGAAQRSAAALEQCRAHLTSGRGMWGPSASNRCGLPRRSGLTNSTLTSPACSVHSREAVKSSEAPKVSAAEATERGQRSIGPPGPGRAAGMSRASLVPLPPPCTNVVLQSRRAVAAPGIKQAGPSPSQKQESFKNHSPHLDICQSLQRLCLGLP